MSTSKQISDAILLGHELSEAEDAASDLWTWLPSHRVARRHHGDHASEFRPAVPDVMKEASMYYAQFKRSPRPKATAQEERDWFLRCPCGAPHEEVGS